ncbi:MAG: O-antigen ligase family protein [Patescibacteria group bacterium]
MANNFFLKLSKFFLYLAPFAAIIVSRSTLFPFIVGKYVFFRIAVDLALLSFVWAWARGETQKPIFNFSFSIFKNPLVIAVSVFTVIFLLAGFFGYDPATSFWSNFERGEGGLQIIHLFIFFILLALLFRDEKSWRKMLIIFLLAVVLAIAYGLLAYLQYIDVKYDEAGNIISGGSWYKTFQSFVGPDLKYAHVRFSGSLGNPAYLGTYVIFALFFTAILLIKTRAYPNPNRKPMFSFHKFREFMSLKNWFLAGLSVLFLTALFLSKTRGAFLGLGIGIVVSLIYFIFNLPKGRLKNTTLIALVILTIAAGTALFYNSRSGGYRIFDINFSTQTFQTRLLLWGQSLRIFKERPIFGWGPENFSIALEKHYLPQFEVWYDRAHNVFFDYLTQTGILGLLSYLGIFATFYWQFFSKTRLNAKQKLLEANKQGKGKSPITNYQSLIFNSLLFALPVAYLVQGIVLFEILPIYISLFVFLAFANYKFSESI